MQIRVEQPPNRVWLLEKTFFKLNNLTCSTWGNMHNVHTCKLATNVKNRPTKSIKMSAIEVDINSNPCKFELSDLEIGCGFKKKKFFELNRLPTMGRGKCKKWPSGVLTFTTPM